MTVPIQDPIVSYTGNGVATQFTIPFRILVADDLKVLLGGVLSSAYSIDGLGDDEATITFTTAPASGVSIVGYRQVALERTDDYQFNGDLRAVTVNAEFDRIWMALQDIGSTASRAIHYPVDEFDIDGTLPAALQRAGNLLGFDDQGDVTMLPLPASVGAGDLRTDVFVAGTHFTPGSTSQIVLSRAPGSVNNMTVHFDGVYQGPENVASLVGNVLTFTAPIPLYTSRVYVQTGTSLSIYAPPGDLVKDALMYVNTSGQSIPNNAQTRVTAWTNRFDRLQKNFDAPSGTFVAPAGGFYRVSAAVDFKAAMPVNTLCSALIVMNGNEPSANTVAAGERFVQSASASAHQVQVSAVIQLNAGAYINLAAFQNSGGSVALSTDMSLNSFAVDRIV